MVAKGNQKNSWRTVAGHTAGTVAAAGHLLGIVPETVLAHPDEMSCTSVAGQNQLKHRRKGDKIDSGHRADVVKLTLSTIVTVAVQVAGLTASLMLVHLLAITRVVPVSSSSVAFPTVTVFSSSEVGLFLECFVAL